MMRSPTQLSDQASKALLEGRLGDAHSLLEQAICALEPEHDEVAPPIYENLGLVYLNVGRWGAAVRAFVRALDGDATSREQSARFLVTCLVSLRLYPDARRALAAYERVFGTHPDGWSDAGLAEKETLWRRYRSKTVPG